MFGTCFSNFWVIKLFWCEIAITTYFLINHSPSTLIDEKTLEEVWSSTPASYANLKIFSCPAYAHVDNSKLESRS